MPCSETTPTSRTHRFSKFAGALATGLALASLTVVSVRAGDILRGGAPARVARPNSNADSGVAAAAVARSNAQDALARTSQALNAVKAMQAAARAAAQAGANNLGVNPNNPAQQLPNVPDGLAPGGLQFVSATGASAPKQGAGGRGVQVTVKQTVQQALLNWSKFNIGKNTTLHFDQSAGGADVGQWVAFNKVNDPTGEPSQILGSITAPGQVYVINQNGIIFGGSSQVNVHTLVASSLPINPNLISRGLLNNPAGTPQFLFSAIAQPAGPQIGAHDPTEGGTVPPPPNGRYGNVSVQPGAELIAPTSDARVGGRIMLVGANVTNAGTISTPDGQTILAAGLQVGIAAHATSSPSLRGLDVWVGSVESYAGNATNSGAIEALRGNVTITGKSVNQLGSVSSSTSVSLNGRIDLLANYGATPNSVYDPVNFPDLSPFVFRSTGNVTLGAKGVTRILPEWSSAETVVGTELALRSQVNIQGKTVYMAPGSMILAPNALVSVNAGVWDYVDPQSTFVHAGGQIYLDKASFINVAGSTDIPVPLSQAILTVTLRGAEFADSPLQRTSIFRPGDGSNPSITVDLRKTGTYNGFNWVGTPLANLTGYLGLIQRTVGELTVAAGSVNLNAGGSVVVQPGASVDVSGGYVTYGSGFVRTTRVLYAGQLLDIADATPNRLYQGIFTGLFSESHPRWGVNLTYVAPWMAGDHFEPSYIQGANGGSLSITAPSVALDGNFDGNTLAGPRQRSSPPTASSFTLDLEAQQLIASANYPPYSPTPPAITFEPNPGQAPADSFVPGAVLRPDRVANVYLDPALLSTHGFGNLKVTNPDGDITVPAKTVLDAPPKGSIILAGANIDVQGNLRAPGGTISLAVYNISPSVAAALAADPSSLTPKPEPLRGLVKLGSNAQISTAGLIVDDRLSAPAPLSQPLVTGGGSVSITGYSAELNSGSVIDVSGGVAVSPTGNRSYGDAGSIVIKTGQDPNILSLLGGHLTLGATLKGFSGAKGGSLSIQAPLIQIGGATANPDTLLLSPDFFSEGGFGSFTLTGLGATTDTPDKFVPAVSIAPGTKIEPVAQSLVAVLNPPGSATAQLIPVVKPEGLRTPVSLAFRAPGVVDDFNGLLIIRGAFVMGAGARISTDALASVSVSAQTVDLLGSIFAPGGTISITGANSFPSVDLNITVPLPTVHIGPASVLSTAGKVLLAPDFFGRRIGSVLPGGSISISGNIVAESGAVLDVSGASDILDLTPAQLGLNDYLNGPTAIPLVPFSSGLTQPLHSIFTVPTRVDSGGGAITLKGGEELFVDATLLGEAGGSTALGGTLSVSSGRYYLPGSTKFPDDVNLMVHQSGATLPAGFAGFGRPLRDASGNVIPGRGYFSADSFQRGGFDSLTLGGNVQFTGPVSITARGALSVGSGGVITADSAVNLTAVYVKLGQPFLPPIQQQNQSERQFPFTFNGQAYPVPPTFGPGSLTVKAQLIDVGNLVLKNIGSTSLIADNGAIRGDGTLEVAGSLYLRAAQIYPATAVNFNIVARDYSIGAKTIPGSITIAGSGTSDLPLSAAGQLSIYASSIYQGGVLRAPLGTINVGWDGTGTAPVDPITNSSVPIGQQVTLAAGSITSVSAVNPVNGQPLLIPYGFSPDGLSWIDPTGIDITAGGFPTKGITIAGRKVTTQPGSSIDIGGGGDVYAYQWIPGNGGSRDVLASSGSFAVIPDYAFNYSPYAPFNASDDSLNLASSNPGYINGSLSVGDRVYLGGSAALPAGVYTLLPARYGLLPDAVLVTPQSGAPVGTFSLPDGSQLVSGYRFNDLNSSRSLPGIFSRFEVAPASVVRARSQYADFSGNTFLAEGAAGNGQLVPRLPQDAGHLILQASQSLALQGAVNAGALPGGRRGLVDISTPQDIFITAPGGSGPAGALVLDATHLSGFNAESLLIGGVRQIGSNGTVVVVATNNITVDNAGTPLAAPEVILVSNKTLTLAPGALILQSGAMGGPSDTLLLGNAAVPGSGNGTLLRVSGDPDAAIIRSGVTQPNAAAMTIGDFAQISGASITLDSTYATFLSSKASLTGQTVNLNSGQVSLQLDESVPVTHNTIGGLELAGVALHSVESARSLSLLSYTTLDIYGGGQAGSSGLGTLALHAAEIRGYQGGTAILSARDILIDNSASGAVPGPTDPLGGTLVFDANVITLGTNQVAIDQYSNVQMNASGGILTQGTGGLKLQGALSITTPEIAGARSSNYAITAAGTVTMLPSGGTGGVTGGLGATLAIQSQNSTITAGSAIQLPSGSLTLRGAGTVTVSGMLDVGGTAQTFFDLVKYTDAGQITLTSDNGGVSILPDGVLNLSAQPAGGNAGTLNVNAPNASFSLAGSMLAMAGGGGQGGAFSLNVGSLPSLAATNGVLNTAGFTQSRSFHVHTGDVLIDGSGINAAIARVFNLSADAGNIEVTGTIDASGATGGAINLQASGNVLLDSGALLTVAGQNFDNAGKGGAISLEAGSAILGVANVAAFVDIQTGSSLDFSVAANTGSSASLGQFTGTLHLRQPQNTSNNLQVVKPINGSLNPSLNPLMNPSAIILEGFKLFPLTGSGLINATVQGNVRTNGNNFAANSPSITSAINLGTTNPGAAANLVVVPGAEIFNLNGNLTLGAANSTSTSDWNLGLTTGATAYRFGTRRVPGVLTLRASGDLVFFNALSDGFSTSLNTSLALTQNTNLPTNVQSWSYRMAAGSDFTASNFRQVNSGTGSLQLGKNGGLDGLSLPSTIGPNGTTSSAINNRLYQVIRTGTGDIDIAAGADVRLLNQFATIYTAGVRVLDPTMGGTFDVPTPVGMTSGSTGNLGVPQESQSASSNFGQYTLAGGNVTINAGGDITHLTKLQNAASLTADSERQLPINWLNRRGYVTQGQFGTDVYGMTASTTWWVDFMNFFEGVGALGGGNVTMIAGRDVSNVDGLVPTNARMPKGTPNASALVELGGGDLLVRAGHDISGGVYYVERGHGTLTAGNSITTNSTRSPSLTILNGSDPLAPETWLPTTLFLGKGGFNVSARSDVLLGPVANPFLIPQGFNNSFWYKTYFSTYSPTSFVDVSALGGNLTFRESITMPAAGVVQSAVPILWAWMQSELLLSTARGANGGFTASEFHPWLRLAEDDMTPFKTVTSLMPGTIKATSFSGDINLVGTLTLSPAPTGTIDLAAGGSINGFQRDGATSLVINGISTTVKVAGSSSINLSDANPGAINGITSPFAYQSLLPSSDSPSANSSGSSRLGLNFLTSIDGLFNESGSTEGNYAVIQTKQALHAAGLLHALDPNPVHLYATGGDISGLDFFSAKTARILAGNDITDISFYIQNNTDGDISVVSAGHDIIPYNVNSLLRNQALARGDVIGDRSVALIPLVPNTQITTSARLGDIQISGPGSLEVLAGRNLDLGAYANATDGTGVGLTSIGNGRNPYLPFGGASIIAGAGLGLAGGLDSGAFDFPGFISQYVTGPDGAKYLAELSATSTTTATTALTPDSFTALPTEEQNRIALDVFYLVLRDAGRDHTTSGGNYETGFAAIASLFPNPGQGSIITQSRDIRTKSGGGINLLAPGGGLTLQTSNTGSTLTPPGVITEYGGSINIFTNDSVNLGISRIFTLRGGDITIWSSAGDIAAGASSKTVASAPPTRVLIDPQSADVKTDLAGLATGGGIGVLATVAGVAPGNVDLIAPAGVVDAGDAGIRATGNLNIAATAVLNASNIAVGGSSAGTPAAAVVSAPNVAGISAASNAAGAGTNAASEAMKQNTPAEAAPAQETPSIITVEVLGYGGSDDDEEERKRRQLQQQ